MKSLAILLIFLTPGLGLQAQSAVRPGSAPRPPASCLMLARGEDAAACLLATDEAARACSPNGTCPPLEADGKARVARCYYTSGIATGFNCLLVCTYANGKTWGRTAPSSNCN